ncbi:MAG: SRPBCC family protein [Actinomycetota bacterium]
MEVNNQAPAIATGEIEIRADPEVVWDLLADIDNWPNWNPDVKEAKLMGGLRESSVFRWKAGPGTITSTLESVDRPQEIGWRGKTMGINAVHVYRLEPHGEGTKVHTEESFDGLIVRLFKGSTRKSLQKGIDGGLVSLKKEAERRSTP